MPSIQRRGDVSLKKIAQRQEISEKYLKAIIKLLVKAGLPAGVLGQGGGCKPARPSEQYTVGEILRLTEDSLAHIACLEEDAAICPRASECRSLPVWIGLDKAINEYLDNITAADLIRRGDAGNDYAI